MSLTSTHSTDASRLLISLDNWEGSGRERAGGVNGVEEKLNEKMKFKGKLSFTRRRLQRMRRGSSRSSKNLCMSALANRQMKWEEWNNERKFAKVNDEINFPRSYGWRASVHFGHPSSTGGVGRTTDFQLKLRTIAYLRRHHQWTLNMSQWATMATCLNATMWQRQDGQCTCDIRYILGCECIHNENDWHRIACWTAP